MSESNNTTTESAPKKTSWKKHNDSRYISGDDLKSSFNGLKPEMVVVITSFEDGETYDDNTNLKAIKTILHLKELNGKDVYKPLVLNKTNSRVCEKEFKSEFMEDWLNLPIVLYVGWHKVHGNVARLKKYNPPPKTTDKRALELLSKCDTKEKLNDCWLNTLNKEERNFPTVIAEKERMKTVFEVKV